MSATPGRLRLLLITGLLVIASLAALQVWSAIETRRVVEAALDMPIERDAVSLERERLRQETIAKQIENRSKSLLWTNLAGAIVATLGLVLSIAGAVGTAFVYLETREKERRDRLDAQLKDREDRLAASFNDTIARLASGDARERKVGAAGLVYFLAPGRTDFHLQAYTSLIAAAGDRREEEDVRRSLRLAAEQAVRNVDPAILRAQSWKDVWLREADLAGCDLSGLDLRDVQLQDANLAGARLVGADLTAAQLQGANLAGADLTGARLNHADLAGGSLRNAVLAGTSIEGLKLLNLDLEGARIDADVTGWRNLPWEAAADWRRAQFAPPIRAALDRRYGAEAPPLRVLMLMWEMPPQFVAGGTWTACYHLVRKLRLRGADVTVVAPWPRELIANSPFGVEVPVVGLDIVPPPDQPMPYGAPAWSPYGTPARAWSPYGAGAPAWSPYGAAAPAWSPYGVGAPTWSPYAAFAAWSPYAAFAPAWSPYAAFASGWSPYGAAAAIYGGRPADPAAPSTGLYRLMGEYGRRLQRWLADRKFDLIHAHDWVTFEAARLASEATGAPWIAHFHSTEAERQPGSENHQTIRYEQRAIDGARLVVAPGRATADRLERDYGADVARLAVVPNLLSDGTPPSSRMGRFETRRVVYLGRLSRQKGVDLFITAAEKARGRITFRAEIVGAGYENLPGHDWLERRGPLSWEDRGEAFRGASLVVVPSRFEPFGMVILEGMQHRVPVVYPAASGAAEVLSTGHRVDPEDTDALAGLIVRLLADIDAWEATVHDQAVEIDAYPDRGYEDRILDLWRAAVAAPAAGAGLPAA